MVTEKVNPLMGNITYYSPEVVEVVCFLSCLICKFIKGMSLMCLNMLGNYGIAYGVPQRQQVVRIRDMTGGL